MSRYFDGTDDYVIFDGEGLVNIGGGSVSGWYWHEDLNDNGVIIATSHNSSNNRQFPFFCDDLGDGTHKFRVLAVDEITAAVVFSCNTNNAFSNNAWHHFCYTTVDGSGTFNLYIDGVDQALTFSTGSMVDWFFGNAILTGDDVQIGSKSDASGAHQSDFKGYIAHIIIHSGSAFALKSREVIQEMLFPGSITKGLYSYHPLWGTSSPEPDYSGSRRNGTVTGATAGETNPPINGIFQVPRPELVTVF